MGVNAQQCGWHLAVLSVSGDRGMTHTVEFLSLARQRIIKSRLTSVPPHPCPQALSQEVSALS